MRGGKQPRILYATQASTRPPRFVIFASGFIEAGYRRFVERRLRETFGFEGSPIESGARARGGAGSEHLATGVAFSSASGAIGLWRFRSNLTGVRGGFNRQPDTERPDSHAQVRALSCRPASGRGRRATCPGGPTKAGASARGSLPPRSPTSTVGGRPGPLEGAPHPGEAASALGPPAQERAATSTRQRGSSWVRESREHADRSTSSCTSGSRRSTSSHREPRRAADRHARAPQGCPSEREVGQEVERAEVAEGHERRGEARQVVEAARPRDGGEVGRARQAFDGARDPSGARPGVCVEARDDLHAPRHNRPPLPQGSRPRLARPAPARRATSASRRSAAVDDDLNGSTV